MKYLSKIILILVSGFIGLFAAAPDTAWTKNYGRDNHDEGKSVQQTSDGGYIIAGTAEYDVLLLKTDSIGDSLWAKNYGVYGEENGESVQQTSDGGYIVAGLTYTSGAGGSDVYLIKTDTLGDSIWAKTYGGIEGDYGYSVQQTSDGGYIVAGKTYSFDTDGNVYLIKTDSIGDTLWTKTYGVSASEGYSVQQTSDGGYIVTGRAYYDDILLIKTDTLGDSVWVKIYGGIDVDCGYEVQQTSDGGYIVAATTSSFGTGGDVYLIKTNSSGDTLWTKTCGGASSELGYSVQQTSDGGYIVAGLTYSFGEGGNVYLIKLKSEDSGIEEEIKTDLFSLSPAAPNPFTTRTIIRYELSKDTDIDISVYNFLGQKVKILYTGKQFSGVYEATWNGTRNSGEKLSTGIYFLNIKAGGKKVSRKVTFVK